MSRYSLGIALVLGVIAGWSNVAHGQSPSGTTWEWDKVQKPNVPPANFPLCPTFKLSGGGPRTELDSASGVLTFPGAGGKLYELRGDVQFKVLSDGGGGIWNTQIDFFLPWSPYPGAANKFRLAGSDGSLPPKTFSQTVNVRVEFTVKYREIPSPRNPSPSEYSFVISTTKSPTPP